MSSFYLYYDRKTGGMQQEESGQKGLKNTGLCRKAPSSAQERAILSPGKDGEADDVCSIGSRTGAVSDYVQTGFWACFPLIGLPLARILISMIV